MKIKMKRCLSCNTLLSNSSKVCTKCDSKELEKGIYTDESNKSVIFNKQLNELNSEIVICPTTCGVPVTLINGRGKCRVCEELFIDGISYH